MELEVAPTDMRSHRDLLQRIIQATDLGLKVTQQDYHLTDYDDSDLPEDEEWPDYVEWETVGEVPINLEAVRERIRQRGYKNALRARYAIEISAHGYAPARDMRCALPQGIQIHRGVNAEDLLNLPPELQSDFTEVFQPILKTDPLGS